MAALRSGPSVLPRICTSNGSAPAATMACCLLGPWRATSVSLCAAWRCCSGFLLRSRRTKARMLLAPEAGGMAASQNGMALRQRQRRSGERPAGRRADGPQGRRQEAARAALHLLTGGERPGQLRRTALQFERRVASRRLWAEGRGSGPLVVHPAPRLVKAGAAARGLPAAVTLPPAQRAAAPPSPCRAICRNVPGHSGLPHHPCWGNAAAASGRMHRWACRHRSPHRAPRRLLQPRTAVLQPPACGAAASAAQGPALVHALTPAQAPPALPLAFPAGASGMRPDSMAVGERFTAGAGRSALTQRVLWPKKM